MENRAQENLITESFSRKSMEKNIPWDVVFEITSSCNLKCVHCNVTRYESRSELSTDEIKDLIVELRSAGTFSINLTGGEPFLREDFREISRFVRENRMNLRISTNATLFSDDDISFLKDIGVYSVGISFYSHRAEIHDSVTQVRGSFEKTFENVLKLKRAKVPVFLKFLVMNMNFDDLEDFLSLADEIELKTIVDFTITPGEDCSRGPLKYRISDEQMMEIFGILSSRGLLPKRECRGDEDSFLCLMGRNVCGISPIGEVFPCLHFTMSVGDVRSEGFSEIWESADILKRIRSLQITDFKGCFRCKLRNFCTRCSGIAYLEEGDFLAPSSDACRRARLFKKFVLGT